MTRKEKLLKNIAIAFGLVALIAVAFGIREHRIARMTAYAAQHDCEWHYSGYIDEEPICR